MKSCKATYRRHVTNTSRPAGLLYPTHCMASCRLMITSLIIFSIIFTKSFACIFTIINNCPYTIWPATLAGSGTPQLPATGFQLDWGQSIAIPSVPGWSGRIWGRTGCMFDETGAGSCQTGDCGGRLECDGIGGTPPISLFEITLGVGDDKDFYDVSVVDGYNLPLIASPRGVHGRCNATGCIEDINMGCPKELQVIGNDNEGGEGGGIVACKSACGAFGLEQYCCSGEFANPTTCKPSFYSGIFKRACPRAYSYAFDDGTSTFTCKSLEYAIMFCPNSGMRRVDGAFAIVESRSNIAAVNVMASSSTIVLPSSISILIFGLLFAFYFWHGL